MCRNFAPFSTSISIHALREESDVVCGVRYSMPVIFQSTLSVRRATITPRDVHVDDGISIHALREESDLLGTKLDQFQCDFNPRSP